MKIIKLTNDINPYALKVVMGYYGVSQSELCKNIKELSQPNLSKFLKGYSGILSENKLKEIMDHFDWPFDFLYKYSEPMVKSKLKRK